MTNVSAFTPIGRIAELAAHLAARPDETAKDDRDRLAELAAGLDAYPASVTSGPSPALAALEAATRSEDWAQHYETDETSVPLQNSMLSGNFEGQFLQTLLGFGGARRALEIGLFTGFGALAMAEALPDDGLVVALEIDAFAADFARKQFNTSPHGHKIEIRVAPAAESLAALANEGARFDFIFIDADKTGYWSYYETILDRDLLAEGGLIAVDNTMLGGEAWREADRGEMGAAIAEFNRKLLADERTRQVLVPIRDGVTLIRRA
ncbi:MAG: class I SAM-dependent methyltransferase [Erythrobacter sp.]